MARGKRIVHDDIMRENEETKEFKDNIGMSPTQSETMVPETRNGFVENSLYVNVRKEPSYDSEVIDILRKGDKVTVLGKVGEFYKISTSRNKNAYISSIFVREE